MFGLPGGGGRPLIPAHGRQRKVGLSEFKASLVYEAFTQRNPFSTKKKKFGSSIFTFHPPHGLSVYFVRIYVASEATRETQLEQFWYLLLKMVSIKFHGKRRRVQLSPVPLLRCVHLALFP